jgi:hypothetical protein
VSWLEWWTAERVIALAAVGQLVVLVAAALFARAQVREARELRAEQARPFVVVDFELDRRPLINLVVANLGKTMAATCASPSTRRCGRRCTTRLGPRSAS